MGLRVTLDSVRMYTNPQVILTALRASAVCAKWRRMQGDASKWDSLITPMENVASARLHATLETANARPLVSVAVAKIVEEGGIPPFEGLQPEVRNDPAPSTRDIERSRPQTELGYMDYRTPGVYLRGPSVVEGSGTPRFQGIVSCPNQDTDGLSVTVGQQKSTMQTYPMSQMM